MVTLEQRIAKVSKAKAIPLRAVLPGRVLPRVIIQQELDTCGEEELQGLQ